MSRLLRNTVCVLSVVVFCCLLYLSVLNVYQTDDYVLAYGVRVNRGVFANMVDHYLTWTGRYFSFLLVGLSTLNYSTSQLIPKVLPPIYLILFLLLTAQNLRFFFGLHGKELLVKTFSFLFFYLICLLSFSENLFWFTGSLVYLLPIILSLTLILFLGKFYRTKKKYYLWLSIALIVLINGCNEIISLIGFGIFLTRLLLKKDKPSRILFLASLVTTVILFAAPGNYARLDLQDVPVLSRILKMTKTGIYDVFKVAIKVLLILPWLVFIFRKELQSINAELSSKALIYLFVTAVAVIGFMSAIQLSASRALDNLTFFVLLITAIQVSVVYQKDRKSLLYLLLIIYILPPQQINRNHTTRTILNFNIYDIAKDTFQTDLRGYDQEMAKRHEILRISKAENIVLKPIMNIPSALYFQEMGTAQDRNYINKQLERFYDKKSVTVKY